MPTATVIATATGVVPLPAGWGRLSRLLRVSWQDGPIRMHCAGPGFWWMLTGARHESIHTIAGFPAGAEITLEWE